MGQNYKPVKVWILGSQSYCLLKMLKKINNDYPNDLIFSLQRTLFFDLTIQVVWSTLLLLKTFSNFVHMSFKVLLWVFLNCIMLLTFFEGGSSRACVRYVLPTSYAIGQCRLQSVWNLNRLKFGRWKFVFSTFGIDWFCTLLGRIVHGSILDGSFVFTSGSMLLPLVKVRIKLRLFTQP